MNLGSLAIEVNWIKCCLMLPADTEEICNQCQTWYQRELSMSQCKKKCVDVSNPPQPVIQTVSVMGMTCRRTKLSFVKSLLRRSRHTNTDTFDEICLCQISSTIVLSRGSPIVVRKQYIVIILISLIFWLLKKK